LLSGINEESISENAFDLILSFDDVINMGYRESVTLQQIQTYLEMESSEEKLFIKLQKVFIRFSKLSLDERK
jgi:coatomer subunit delta